MISKLQKLSALSATLGIASLLLEQIFYNEISKDGVLQESLFLPIGFLLLSIGVILFLIDVIWLAINFYRTK